MKIYYSDGRKRIDDVQAGECFMFNDSMYIKTDESVCDVISEGDRRYKCVDINSGYLTSIADWQVVKVVDAEVVVK